MLENDFAKERILKVNIQISDDSFAGFDNWFETKDYSSVFVLTDYYTAKHCYPLFVRQSKYADSFRHLSLEEGESSKTIASCEIIWNYLLESGADRKSLLINLGGGMISDLGGFAASAFKRGISFVNMPSSLLAMIDASFGGKTAVNLQSYKNQIGLFSDPSFVFVYLPFLKTLTDDHYKAAWGEILKYALIADESLWYELQNKGLIAVDDLDKDLIEQCVRIKTAIAEADPFEENIRKKLNFGHTIGHALETLSFKKGGKELLHGNAVAAGCLAESIIAARSGILSREEVNKISKFVLSNFGKISFEKNDIVSLLSYMKKDKKNSHENINFTMISFIGDSFTDHFADQNVIEESLIEYLEL